MTSLALALLFLSSPEPAAAAGAEPPHWLSCSALETPHGTLIVDRIAYLFFDTDSAVITAPGAAMLDGFMAQYDAPAHCQVVIDGSADRAGSEAHNLDLSRRRARAVAAYLRRKGLAAPMVLGWHGESRPLVETADDVAEPHNRYVVVWVNDPPPAAR